MCARVREGGEGVREKESKRARERERQKGRQRKSKSNKFRGINAQTLPGRSKGAPDSKLSNTTSKW